MARLVNTMLDARELIEAVMLDFGLDPQPGQSKPHLLRDLARFLVDQRNAKRLPLLIIDEAQNLSQAALEEVRMLSNLETEKSKLIQIVLVGQPNLHDVLSRPEFEQLRQRVTVRYHLRPLDPGETAAYINHRLRKAALGAPLVLSSEVTDLIGEASGGLPRMINVISDAVLLFGYGDDKHVIDAPLVREVITELTASGVLTTAARVATVPPVAAPTPVAAEAMPVAAAAPLRVAAPSSRAAEMAADAARANAEAAARLAAREEALDARERDLAEQRRVVTEQARLLKQQLSLTATPPAAAWPPPKPGGPAGVAAVRGAAPTVPPRLFSATQGRAPRPGLWTRLVRTLSGTTGPVFEE